MAVSTIPSSLAARVISCGGGNAPVLVVPFYRGGVVPIPGVSVTLYLGAIFPGFPMPVVPLFTDNNGIAQTCVDPNNYVEAWVQKGDVDFGSGVGQRYKIDGAQGGAYRKSGIAFSTNALTSPPAPHKPPTPQCSGFMSVSLPNFTDLLSSPRLPSSIPISLNVSGTGLPESIPLEILVDGRKVTNVSVEQGPNNIDILSIIKILGTAALNSGHEIVIRSTLADCYIPQTAFSIPPLVPAGLPCSGLLSILQPNFLSLLSGPSLPGSIPVPVSITGTGLPSSIPLSILVEGSEVTTATGVRNGSVNIDVLSIIQSLGTSALNTGHTIEIRPNLPDCNIPAASLSVPALIPAAITQPCTEGETQTFRCPDGSTIVIARCKRDPVTGINVFVPTGEKCPIPGIELGKKVNILTYPAGAAIEAFDGMDVTVTASVVCGAAMSNGETAIFTVDGNEVSRGMTSGGMVSFTWKATVEPSRTHKLCVSVPKSSQCSQFGEARDCKTITVSRAVPEILERLKKEREAYLSQLEAQRVAREKIREISLTLPQQPSYAPEVTVPEVPTIPTTPSVPVPPPTEQVPGVIDIPTVTVPPGVPYPVEIRIDGNIIGQPPVYKEVTPGTHTVTISLKGFTPISKKVNITAGQILTIEEAFT